MDTEKMDEEIAAYVSKYSGGIQELFARLRGLVLLSAAVTGEKLWARLPSFYCGENFVRLIPFANHINVEAAAAAAHRDELAGFGFTPKGMLQIRPGQELPEDVLLAVFRETLAG